MSKVHEVRREDGRYRGGKIGKEGWDDRFAEMGTSFYTRLISSWPRESHLMSCQRYQHETARRTCRKLEDSGKETFDVS